jgi:hypothetical protein
VGARFRFGRPSSSASLGGAVEAGGTKGPSGNDRLTVISSGGDGARDRGGGAPGDLIAKVIGRGGVSRTVVTPSSSSSSPGDYEKKLNTKGFYTQIGDGEVAGQEGECVVRC